MGLNHLREWIAPGYSHDKPANSQEDHFYNEIYKQKDFKTINALCNRTKHLSTPQETGYGTGLTIDEWPDISSVLSFDDGPPSAFYVDGEELAKPLRRLLEDYRNKWFSVKRR